MLKQIIRDAFDDTYMTHVKDGNHEYWELKIYADYRDELDPETASKIINADDPQVEFWQEIDCAWLSCLYEYEKDLHNEVLKFIDKHEDEYDETASEDEVWDAIADYVSFGLPYDHYLSQEFNVVLRLDTGNVNYDMSCDYNDDTDEIDPHSSLLWLVKQQGYTAHQLVHEYEGNKFLKSVMEERSNAYGGTLTFLLRLSLEKLMDIVPHLRKKPFITDDSELITDDSQGYITLPPGVTCGIFDSFNGSGSLMSVELEKEVKIPLPLVYTLDIDGQIGCYGVDQVYGLCDYVWDYGCDFKAPETKEEVTA